MALVNGGNTSGLGYQPPWEMSEQVANYFDKTYKDNPLRNIEYYTGGGYLLEPKQFLPYYDDNGNPIDPYWTSDKEGNAGYTYPGEEEIYLRGLNNVGLQAEHPNKNVQAFIDWRGNRIARTGVHESIHNNLYDAYPNAMAQMLRGTSVLGVPMDETPFLGFEESPQYAQNELLTQALTEHMMPLTAPPLADPASLVNLSPIYADYDYSHWNMDRPGGPMTKAGLDNFLMKKTKPFYNQLLEDAKKGYVQDSIWATPPHLWGIRTKGT